MLSIRSLFVVQQMQPLLSSIMSSALLGDDQIVVDADVAELVDKDGGADALAVGEDVVDQGCTCRCRGSR